MKDTLLPHEEDKKMDILDVAGFDSPVLRTKLCAEIVKPAAWPEFLKSEFGIDGRVERT